MTSLRLGYLFRYLAFACLARLFACPASIVGAKLRGSTVSFESGRLDTRSCCVICGAGMLVCAHDMLRFMVYGAGRLSCAHGILDCAWF
jgi:hypothetical protein